MHTCFWVSITTNRSTPNALIHRRKQQRNLLIYNESTSRNAQKNRRSSPNHNNLQIFTAISWENLLQHIPITMNHRINGDPNTPLHFNISIDSINNLRAIKNPRPKRLRWSFYPPKFLWITKSHPISRNLSEVLTTSPQRHLFLPDARKLGEVLVHRRGLDEAMALFGAKWAECAAKHRFTYILVNGITW